MDSQIGKKIGENLYFHISAIELVLKLELIKNILKKKEQLPITVQPNVIKLDFRKNKLSWLEYDDFDNSYFPELLSSWTFDIESDSEPNYRTYQNSLNPPILHRKELLVPIEYPNRDLWVKLTETAEALGFFDDTTTIGFALNWKNTIEKKGYRFIDGNFLPIGNELENNEITFDGISSGQIKRHLTALSRTTLSAPVQLLLRHKLLHQEVTFFDYGCGRGNDITSILGLGIKASGWDPYFANNQEKYESDVVNIGFVLNVIENPAERVEALQKAFFLTRRVLAVSVMLMPTELNGVAFQDGIKTSRNTFQKYFGQSEFKSYIEDVLQHEAFMVGPGVAFVFTDKILEQSFDLSRYRARGVGRRFTNPRTPRVQRTRTLRSPQKSHFLHQFEEFKYLLEVVWEKSLDLGRFAERDEIENLEEIEKSFNSYGRALRLIATHFDIKLLHKARNIRTDDLKVYLAIQQFSKRPKYRTLSVHLQRDLKAFFGNYASGQAAGVQLLLSCANMEILSEACKIAAGEGLGYLEEGHSLQLHVSLVDRLPAALRAYVACGLVLWDSLSEIQLLKIHIGSGKLSLMEYENFDLSPLPKLKRRVKINIRKLDYTIFDYGSVENPQPLLYFKSKYLNEESDTFAEQVNFDQKLEELNLVPNGTYGPSELELNELFSSKRLTIEGMSIVRSTLVPDLDTLCGSHLTYRDLIECGETQKKLSIANLPKNVDTYNAFFDLATNILDPVIDYFGGIRLTYGLCTAELGRHINRRVAPDRDQHSSHEIKKNGTFICARLGAACDFIVDDEDMLEVAKWIFENLPFDRLYYYGNTSPLHVSFGPEHSRSAIQMTENRNGSRIPSLLKFT